MILFNIYPMNKFTSKEKKFPKFKTPREIFAYLKSLALFKAFLNEGEENVKMLQTFSVMLMERLNINHRETLPTKDEIKQAIEQLKSIPRFIPICTLMLIPLPFGASGYITISYIIWKLSNKKINILPDKFNILLDEMDKRNPFRKKKKE